MGIKTIAQPTDQKPFIQSEKLRIHSTCTDF